MKLLSNTTILTTASNVFNAQTVRITNDGTARNIILANTANPNVTGRHGDYPGGQVSIRLNANASIFIRKRALDTVVPIPATGVVYAESISGGANPDDSPHPVTVSPSVPDPVTRSRTVRVTGGGMIRRNLTRAGNPSSSAIELMDTTFAAQYTDNVDRTQYLHGGDASGANMGSTIYVPHTNSALQDVNVVLREIRPRQDHDRAREQAQGYVAESMRTWTDLASIPSSLISWTPYKFDRTIHEEQVQGQGQVRRRNGRSSWSIELRNALWSEQYTDIANTEPLTTGKSIFVDLADGTETEIRLAGVNGSTAFWISGDYGGSLLNRGVDDWVNYRYYRESPEQ